MGRPRKPAALRALEGNRSRTEIPPEVPLHGTPELPDGLDAVAAQHFALLAAEFGGAGVLKRADTPALMALADLWSKYWRASEAYDAATFSEEREHWAKLLRGFKADWDRGASKLGLAPIDRSRLIVARPADSDPLEERFFKVTG